MVNGIAKLRRPSFHNENGIIINPSLSIRTLSKSIVVDS
jgi:hypothetical protein